MAETMTVSQALQDVVNAGFPADKGKIEAIFIRPVTNERKELQEAELTAGEGVRGDRWSTKDPRTQVTLMNARVLDCVSGGDRSRWGLAGDQLIVDLDLSQKNLPVGQRLRAGGVLMEVTEIPHTGCAKFTARYGAEALAFINAEERTHLRLRGVYVKVVEEGTLRAGDVIRKV